MMNNEFTAKLQPSPRGDGSTYVVMSGSARFFGTRASVKVRGTIDGHPFLGSFIAARDGTHRLPVKPHTLKLIGKREGDTVVIRLEEQFAD